MSIPETIPITTQAPEGEPRPPRLLRTLSMVAIGLIIAGGLLVLLVFHGGHPKPLAQVTLDDGSILQLWAITTGTNHEFVLDRGSGFNYPPFGSGHPRRTADAGFGWDHMIVWLGRVDAETGQPLDLDWFSHCVAVDANGWKNPSSMAGRVQLIENAPQVAEQGLLRDVPPFSPLPEAHYEKIIVGAVLDLAPTEQFTLQVYDTSGRCVAELPAESPVPEKSDVKLTPQPLPATLSDGDLSVTLKGVTVERAADSPVGGTALKLKPDVEFSWRGEDDGSWTYYDQEILAVTDPIGNMGFLNHCTLSPHQPWWKLGFLLRRTAEADFDEDQVWSSGALEIPPAGESRTLDLDQTLKGIHVHLVSIHGPGAIRFSTKLPDCMGAMSPPADSGEGWTASARYYVGGADWNIESTGPVLVYEFVDADMGRNLVHLRAVTDSGQSVAVEQELGGIWKERKPLIAILPDCPADAHAVTVDLILDEYRSVEFVIEPPAVDVDRLTTSPSTGDGNQTL